MRSKIELIYVNVGRHQNWSLVAVAKGSPTVL